MMTQIRFRSRFTIAAFALGLIIILATPEFAAACPSCKAGLANEHHDGLQQGFYWSILFMMSMPFLIISGLSTMFYLSIRKARRAVATQGIQSIHAT